MNRLAELRKNRGMTQGALADLVGVSRQAITQWEAGNRVPSGDILVRLASALGVSAAYLLGISDSPERDDRLPPDWVKAVEEAMADGFTPEEVRRVLKAFRTALGKGPASER